MNILIIGNHTCGNRGDGAILRGLCQAIESELPDVKLTITSRFPVSSSYLLGRPMVHDPFEAWRFRKSSGLLGRFKARIVNASVPRLMLLALRTSWRWPLGWLPQVLRKEMTSISKYDLVIQVGGSFFVDLYGSRQYEYPFAALLAGTPLYLVGHSMGPFSTSLSRQLASILIAKSAKVFLREQVSRELIGQSGLPTNVLLDGADTAWAVTPTTNTYPPLHWLSERRVKRPVVAITARELAPFDKRLGTTQQAYELAFAKLVDAVITAGYDVVAASTCTGIDSYQRDDRMNALRLGALVSQREHFHVEMGELNDVALGEFFGSCVLLIGTRLHSAIIAMNFGTPALAINYEHKSEGIMRQLGLAELSSPIQALLDGSLQAQVLDLLPMASDLREKTRIAVARERERASRMVYSCLPS